MNFRKSRHGHVIEEGVVRHLRLYEELMNRAGGEFMTLGVLAFVTFMCNNTGFFEAISNAVGDEHSFPLPKTQVDWLHMVELVHVKLFAAMMLYFVIMTSVVRSSLKQIQIWESCRLRRLKDKSKEAGSAIRSQATTHHEVDHELYRYVLWREYFIEMMMSWRKGRPLVWKETIEMFGIDSQEEGAATKLRTIVERRFALSAYLSLNVVESVCDSINIHQQTWVSLLVVLASFVVVHRYMKIGLFVFTWVFLGIIIIIMLGMSLGARRRIRKITTFMAEVKSKRQKRTSLDLGASIDGNQQLTIPGIGIQFPDSTWEDEEDDDGPSKQKSYLSRQIRAFHQKFPTEILILRVLQIFLFLKSYMFARTILDFHGWQDETQRTAMLSCVFMIIFFVLTWWLKNWVPTFIALMALPPYVDKINLQLFWAVLANDDENLVPSLRSLGLGQDTPQHSRQMSPCFSQNVLRTTTGSFPGPTSDTSRSGTDANELSAVWAEVGRLRRRLEIVEAGGQVLEELCLVAEETPPQYVNRSAKMCV